MRKGSIKIYEKYERSVSPNKNWKIEENAERSSFKGHLIY